MTDGHLLNIGAFSVLTGLSIAALRHYDEIGLLHPAMVDANTAYRRYALEQVATGRLIRALRDVELPIDAIREVVVTDDTVATGNTLRAHRSELADRGQVLAGMIEILDDYIENGVRMKETKPCRVGEINLGVNDVEVARRFYEAAFELEFTEDQHDDGAVHLMAVFGAWPSDEFFLLNLSDATLDPYRAGRADFGLIVDDLDVVHRRAVAAGGTELGVPREMSGMPRFSTIADPSGNVINLYQNA